LAQALLAQELLVLALVQSSKELLPGLPGIRNFEIMPCPQVRIYFQFFMFVSSAIATEESCTSDARAADAAQALLQKHSGVQHVKGKGEAADKCFDYTKQYHWYDDKKVFGATDVDGDKCSFYADHTSECGNHDDGDFIANEMCCACGGGSFYTGSRSLAVNQAPVFLSTTSDCPSDYKPITSVAACRAALDMVGLSGMDYNGQDAEADWPKGCYYCKNTPGCSNGVWFNTHDSGNLVEGANRLCHNGLYLAKDVNTVFLGDSDIDYWDTSTAFPGSFNLGVGGYTTKDVIKEVDQWVTELDATWVIIVCGENDFSKNKRSVTKAALSRFKAIVTKLIKDGSRVIYMGTKPEPGTKGLRSEYQYYDQEIRKSALKWAELDKTAPPFQMIDVFKSFTSERELYNSDNLHMSRFGYKFWNGWVKLATTSSTPCIIWMDGVCVKTP